MFGQGHDAIKNYYAVEYFVKHDTGFLNSEGMNYPYGELLIYTDGQLFLSWGFKVVTSIFPFLKNYTIGYFNLLQIFSLVLCAVFVYILLQRYNLSFWVSVFGALGIMVLQPQIIRLGAHQGLSYAFIIPLGWWLFEQAKLKKSWKWTVALILLNFISFLIHPYLGLINTLFHLQLVFWNFLFARAKRVVGINYLVSFILLTLPPLLFKGFIALIDTHVNRPKSPYGIFEYQANWSSFFISSNPPLNQFWNGLVEYDFVWEGLAYIGLANIVALLFWFFYLLRKSNRRIAFKNDSIRAYFPAFFSGVFLAIFSTGWFFSPFDPDFILENPIINQFRSIGRFGWVFYYTTGVGSLILLDHIAKKTGNKLVFAFLFLVLMAIEGIPFHPSDFTDQRNPFINDAPTSINTSKYQAILPLPLFTIGSEYVVLLPDVEVMNHTITLSAQTGIPLIGGLTPRTSITEAIQNVNVISSLNYPKPFISELPNTKPLLIINRDPLLKQEQKKILDRAQFLDKIDGISYYEMPLSALTECPDTAQFFGDSNYLSFDTLLENVLHDTNKMVYFNGFENEDTEHVLLGKGAKKILKQGYQDLIELPPYTFQTNTTYELSVWFYVGDNHPQELVGLIHIDDDGNTLDWVKYEGTQSSRSMYKDWALMRMSFQVSEPDKTIRLVAEGTKKNTWDWFDNLIIREIDAMVIQNELFEGDSVSVLNNEILIPCK